MSTYPACTSPTSACRGGRLPCPSPQSCVLGDDADAPMSASAAVVWWLSALLPIGLVSGAALLFAFWDELRAMVSL